MHHALIIPIYGFITPDETLSGGRGTKARIRVAQQLIRDGVVAPDCFVPFPQNMTPRGRERTLIGDVTLGENVAAYVRSLPEFAKAIIYDTDQCAGTFNDTVASIKLIYFEREDAGGGSVHVHFVSDWSQLGRLWIIWYVAFGRERALKEWRASFHLVPNFRTMRDVWGHEPPAYIKCLWRSLHRRFCEV